MKTKLMTICTFVIAFSLSAFASQTTVTGVVTDDMCTKKHMMPGKSNADCVRDCIKHGAKYVVVAGGKVLELKGTPEQFSEFAGKKVKITGDATDKALTVASIQAVQ